jgi:hypothetical protein
MKNRLKPTKMDLKTLSAKASMNILEKLDKTS